MSERMSDERIRELEEALNSYGLSGVACYELLNEAFRARAAEVALQARLANEMGDDLMQTVERAAKTIAAALIYNVCISESTSTVRANEIWNATAKESSDA